MKPVIADFCSGAGGAATGYWQAGFDVVGFDIVPQPNYPFEFIQMDIKDVTPEWLRQNFNASHWSVPCQGYSSMRHRDKAGAAQYPKLIPYARDIAQSSGIPYVIENVEGAREDMRNPVTLCGSSFGLRVRRHRLFESSIDLKELPCSHEWQDKSPCYKVYVGKSRIACGYKLTGVMPVFGGNHLVGGKSLFHKSVAMGVHWMTEEELNEAIPPAYTKFLGDQLIGLV